MFKTVEAHRKYHKKYKASNPEKIKAINCRFNKNHPGKIKEYGVVRYQEEGKKMRAYSKKYSKEHPDQIKKHNTKNNKKRRDSGQANYDQLKSSYGLTPEQFKTMRKKQKNKCAICPYIFIETPHVDHDHKTGKVRGLLCRYCNGGLGFFKDDPKLTRKATAYLEAK